MNTQTSQLDGPPREVLQSRLTAVALLLLIVYGASLRVRGLTSGGLWRDDAWSALSARVGLGTAWHMWVTAPGFYAFERSWILIHPGSTVWDQIPPLIVGIAGIPAMFFMARYFKVGRSASLVAAVIVCISPICVTYSTRLKEYGTDFLLACLVLVAAEAVRRQPGGRRLLLLAVASFGSFAISASIVPVLLGVWLALGIVTSDSQQALRPFFTAGILTTLPCAAFAGIFYSHLSPALHKFWQSYYIDHGSPGAFLSSTGRVVLSLSAYLTGTNSHARVLVPVLLVLVGFLGVGIFQSRAMLAPALVLGSAIVASAFSVIPLATGRTDEVLYPAVLLLIASGLQKVGDVVLGRLRPLRWTAGRRWALGVAVAVIVVVMLLSASAIRVSYDRHFSVTLYPTEDTHALAVKVDRELQPGDHIVVSETMRYPWALYEDTSLRFVFNRRWATGFSIVNTQPGIFIAPSENYEGGSDPATWTKMMVSYKRLWFVETPPLSFSPFYTFLRKAGWHTVKITHATGCEALLLVRTT